MAWPSILAGQLPSPASAAAVPIGAGRMPRGGTILKLQFLYFIVGPLIHLVEICECSE